MPLRDGTGPFSEGPKTGRGWGRCFKTGTKISSRPGGLSGGRSLLTRDWFWTAVVLPLGTAVIHDLTSSNSAIKRIVGRLPHLIGTTARKRLPPG